MYTSNLFTSAPSWLTYSLYVGLALIGFGFCLFVISIILSIVWKNDHLDNALSEVFNASASIGTTICVYCVAYMITILTANNIPEFTETPLKIVAFSGAYLSVIGTVVWATLMTYHEIRDLLPTKALPA